MPDSSKNRVVFKKSQHLLLEYVRIYKKSGPQHDYYPTMPTTMCEPKAIRKSKSSDRKKTLHGLILSLLSPTQIWKLRERYAEGRETIVEMARSTQCPPALLYCVLTPLWSKTAMKLRLLRLEKEITLLRFEGWSVRKIARHLKRPERVVREHCDERFSEAVFLQRPWYNERAPRPRDPDELVYDEKTLPPTTRLGWQDGQLLDIPEDRKGRCATCGHIVSLPCLACRLREDMEQRKIAPAEVFDPADEEDDIEPDLLFL